MPPRKGMWRVRVELARTPRSVRRVESVGEEERNRRRWRGIGVPVASWMASLRSRREVEEGLRLRAKVFWFRDVMKTMAVRERNGRRREAGKRRWRESETVMAY